MAKLNISVTEEGDGKSVKRSKGGWISNVFLAVGLLWLAYMALTGEWMDSRMEASSYREDPTSWGRN